MSTIIVSIAAILIIALVWSLIKETKNSHLTFPSEKVELTQEDKEWLEAPLDTPPVAEPIVEPVVEPEVEPVVEPIIEPVAEPVVEVKPVAAPKKKSTRRYPPKKKPSATK